MIYPESVLLEEMARREEREKREASQLVVGSFVSDVATLCNELSANAAMWAASPIIVLPPKKPPAPATAPEVPGRDFNWVSGMLAILLIFLSGLALGYLAGS